MNLARTWGSIIVALLVVVIFAACSGGTKNDSSEPPPSLEKNVVVFFLDDPVIDAMKVFSRIHLYQRKIDGSFDPAATDPAASNFYVDLPVMDKMAGEGVFFTEFNAMPGCSPSRACILTGMYPFKRHGQGSIEYSVNVWDDLLEFNSQPGFVYPVVPEVLRRNGIGSSMVGKWHLALHKDTFSHPSSGLPGTGWEHIPLVGKWHQYVATFSNESDYYAYELYNNGVLETVTYSSSGSFDEPSNRDNLDRTGYLTRTQAIDALDTINSYGNEQFLVYISLNSMHIPIQAPPVDMVRSGVFKTFGWPGKKFKNAQAMLETLDWTLGYVRDGMSPEVLENTVFIIVGDNGTPGGTFKNYDASLSMISGSTGLLGESYKYVLGKMDFNLPPGASPALGPQKSRTRMKMTAFERGTRAPLIIWDGGGDIILNPGRESLAMVDIVDIVPTIYDLMGVDFDPNSLDGVSILPVLEDTVTRQTHERQFSFTEIYMPTGTGPVLNPRSSPDYLGDWSSGLGTVFPGEIVRFHNDLVRYYKALEATSSNPSSSSSWQLLAARQCGFRMDLAETPESNFEPGTYKILRNYFEDGSEYVDHLFKLYDGGFNAVDPIEAYELDIDGQYALEYRAVSRALNRFLHAPPPSPPVF